MRKIFLILVAFSGVAMIACSAGRGCPTNGRNVGAEKLMSGDKQTMKAVKKAGKFNH